MLRDPASSPTGKEDFDRLNKSLILCTAFAVGIACGLLLDGYKANDVRLAMCLGGMALLLSGWLADLWGWKRFSSLVTAVLVGVLVCSAWIANDTKLRELFKEERIQAWNAFHYVLGTKYFDELGYFDLYKCAVLADREADGVFSGGRYTRDMHTYSLVPLESALAAAESEGVRERFSEERWGRFKEDLQAIQSHLPAETWQRTITDLGFNPSPAWLIVHRPLLNAVDIRKPRTLQLLCCADLALYAAAFIVAWWAFGLRRAAVGALWVNLYFGNAGLLAGSYFRNDWLFLTVLAVGLYHKGHRLAAAPVLAYAASMRGFPGLLALHPALCWFRDAVRLRMPARRHTVFLAALAVSCLVLFGLGSTTKHGTGAWLEWREKISVHGEHIPMWPQRVGLKMVFTKDYGEWAWGESAAEKRQILKHNEPYFRAAQGILILAALLAMLKRNEHDGMLLGLVVVFALLVLSRYYASAWALLFTLTPLDRRRIANLASGLWLFGLAAFFYILVKLGYPPTYDAYYAFNVGMLFYFLGICAFLIAKDIVNLRRRPEGRSMLRSQ